MERIGEYEVRRMVGEGGMGKVYEAEERLSKRRVALKVLRPELTKTEEGRRLFLNEMQILAHLEHPNVVRSLATCEVDGQLVMALEFLEGRTLRDELVEVGRMPWPEAVRVVVAIAEGLAAAHAHEPPIVHRDLKPENVMIVKGADDRDHAVVMDFGLAKERKAGPELERLTATGIVLGTPEFMSPEQLRGKPLDGRTDVYSLALMTVEMLTGSLPFTGKSQQELMIARLRNQPTPLRKLRPDLDFPNAVERVLLKALERDPNDRYPTAPDFAAALDAATGPGGLGTTTAALKRWFG
jgi:serine/threonine-protein kinase